MNYKKEYDLVVFIGRFQPFHTGHEHIIQQKAAILGDNVLVIIGSAESPRTPKDPWTAQERESMIRSSVHVSNLYFRNIPDVKYDDNEWIVNIGKAVDEVSQQTGSVKIAIIGHDKDHSSFYLNFFPQWKFIPTPPFGADDTVDSTKIRELMFRGDIEFVKGVVPKSVYKYLLEFKRTDEFALLKREWEFIQAYKQSWAGSPWPPTFVTVDAVVIQSGHILLIQRGEFPGAGLWAIPGGFINENELIVDAVVRELREETGLKVPEKVLKGSVTANQVFDDPSRSGRGRTVTHAFLFKLDDAESLPRVRGGDDAAKAKWVPLVEFEKMRSVMFEDHYFIAHHLLNK